MYNESALNTFDLNIVETLKDSNKYKVIAIKKIKLEPLREILLKTNIEENIDFISIDVEGLDYEVIQSFAWDRYKPKLVVMESLGRIGLGFLQDPAYIFLVNIGYVFYAKTGNSIILELQNR